MLKFQPNYWKFYTQVLILNSIILFYLLNMESMAIYSYKGASPHMIIFSNKKHRFITFMFLFLLISCNAEIKQQEDTHQTSYLLSSSLTPTLFSADGSTVSQLTITAVAPLDTSVSISPIDSGGNLTFLNNELEPNCFLDMANKQCSISVIAAPNSTNSNITGNITFSTSDNSNIEKLNYTISNNSANLISASLSPSDLASAQCSGIVNLAT